MTDTAISSLTLRRACAHDLGAVEDLLTKSNLPVSGVDDLMDSFIVAERDGRVMGAAGVERAGEYGLLRSVVVDPAARGRGVGRALVERVTAESEENGVRELYLLTTSAEKYFSTHGFTKMTRDAAPKEIQNTAEFTDLCPSSAVVMRRVRK